MQGLTRLFIAAGLIAMPLAPVLGESAGSSSIEFPIVFTSSKQMAEFGLSIISSPHDHPPLLHRCHYYGDGGDLITISHQRLLRYRDLGFTLNSLCFGLISETLFDPETGQRLPTYVAIDPTKVVEKKVVVEGKPTIVRHIEPIYVSYEHPLELPRCYYRALPYTDCVFNYDRLTGKPLSEAQRTAFRELGRALDSAFARAIEQRLVCAWPFCIERRTDLRHAAGALAAGGEHAEICANLGYLPHFIEEKLEPHGIVVPKALFENAHLSCFDITVNLPAGYGYTTDADGTAGPALSPAALKTALDPSRQAGQLDPKALAEKLKSLGVPQAPPK